MTNPIHFYVISVFSGRILINSLFLQEVLEGCAKKLEQTLKEISLSDVQTQRNSQTFYSAKKTTKQQSFLEKYLIKSTKKSTRKPSASKFRTTQISARDKKMKCTKELFSENDLVEGKPVKRESLGLLPESCLDEDVFCSPNMGILSEIDSNASLVKKTSRVQDDFLILQPSKRTLENICKDKTVREKLSELLHGQNRHTVWNLLQILDDNLHVSIVKNLVFDQRKNVM